MTQLNVQLLLTGDELMSGDVTDTNSSMIATLLKETGISINKKTTVGDHLETLINELSRASNEADVIIVNGGLGPTVDDKTAEALGAMMQEPLIENKEALSHVLQWCEKRGFPINEPNRKQAILPKSVDVIANSVGSAVGFYTNYNQCLILCTPGVPVELKIMLQDRIIPIIQSRFPSIEKKITRRLQVFGIGESPLQQFIHQHIQPWPKDIELGFRAGYPQIELKLTAENDRGISQLNDLENRLISILEGHIIGENDEQMPEVINGLLKKHSQTITTAESCTGGKIASLITGVSGSSEVFSTGFVTYSNDIKTQLLNVSPNTLEEFGAVSKETVLEMVKEALLKSGSYWGVAVSGIAGPLGGTEGKPVGTVWIAWGDKDNLKAVQLYCPYNRRHFQTYVSHVALDLVRRDILNIKTDPWYFKRRK